MSNEQSAVAEVVSRAWHDTAYRERLIADPKATLADAGLNVADAVSVTVVEDTDELRHLAVPADAGEDQVADLIGRIARMLPLPEGNELRVLQSTASEMYLVLPADPDAGNPLSADDLKSVVGGLNGGDGGYTAHGGNGGNGGVMGTGGLGGNGG